MYYIIHSAVAVALAIAWDQSRKERLFISFCKDLRMEQARKFGFVPFASVQAALDAAPNKHGKEARITFLIHCFGSGRQKNN